MPRLYIHLCCLLMLAGIPFCSAQKEGGRTNYLYADSKGVLRWKKNNQEAAFFGTNYTVPFAYGYRSHLALGSNPERAIDQDVYHMARLGINAFRVHVWDTEISDAAGNLLQNEHLRLFDYLISKLEERAIFILITPIAFWGNGYPEQDEKTGSFSNIYGKDQCVRNEKAIQAQERYLNQFFRHKNPYTGKTYGQDPAVVAVELNNEPHHTGPERLATAYINRLYGAVKKTGWYKPVFYNISESPDYAAAVAGSKADGFSFQWYPTGLVAGHEQKGNFLPNVDRYVIPFDSIPAFRHKPRIIYEFDAADLLQSCMYPAMARSFRSAGFQWATQFAYDPLATAYANTEYQTHYLNLAYTPSKAISMLIAGQVFRNLPLFKSYGKYPADTAFGDFSLRYSTQSSEMNRSDAFYYSNSTQTRPRAVRSLRHIAGVGSSPVVRYNGNGCYFLDRLSDGSWRLEVMPDVQALADPFSAPSLQKEVNRLIWKNQPITINLPELNPDFYILGLNATNTAKLQAVNHNFQVSPGTYLLSNRQMAVKPANKKIGQISLYEFVAPRPRPESPPAGQLKPGKNIKFAVSPSRLTLFDGTGEESRANFSLGEWATNSYRFKPAEGNTPAALEISHSKDSRQRKSAMEFFIGERLLQKQETEGYQYLVICASASTEVPVTVSMVSKSAASYQAVFRPGRSTGEIRIPLQSLSAGPLLLLPRPYPGFQPLYFQTAASPAFQLSAMEKLQLSYPVPAGQEEILSIVGIWLEK